MNVLRLEVIETRQDIPRTGDIECGEVAMTRRGEDL